MIWSLSDKIISALDVIRYSAKSKFFKSSNLLLFTVNFTEASKLDPISLVDLFASIATFASCLIANNLSHFSFNSSFSQLFGALTNKCS